METIMTVPQVAKYLKLPKSKVYLMVQRGKIPHIRIGKNVRVMESDLKDWLLERREPASQLGFIFQK